MRQALFAAAPPDLRRRIELTAGPAQVVARDLQEEQDPARRLQQSPTGRSAGGFLVQPLQRLHGQGRRPLPDHRIRARRDPPARARQVPRPAGGHRQESGDAVLPGQLAIGGTAIRRSRSAARQRASVAA